MKLVISDNEFVEQINCMMNLLDGIENAATSAIAVTNDMIENYFVAEKVDKSIYEKLEMIEQFAINLREEYEGCDKEIEDFLAAIEENDRRIK